MVFFHCWRHYWIGISTNIRCYGSTALLVSWHHFFILKHILAFEELKYTLLISHTLMKHHDTHWWCKKPWTNPTITYREYKNRSCWEIKRETKKHRPLLHRDSFCLSHSALVGLKYSCSILLQCLKHLADRYSIHQ